MPLFAENAQHLDVASLSVAPFVILLLAIAIMPIAAERWWHGNWNKAFVSVGLALPVVGYLMILHASEQPGLEKLEHAVLDYVDFIVLLGALFTIAGGIAVEGQFRPTPLVNTCILALGAVLANLIGTTGASMLLVRPFLRINQVRRYRGHLPIFFVFVASNLGGLLTPLGDPPLFLGFLKGVDFFWTFSLWPSWLVANGCVLAIALGLDTIAYSREPALDSLPPRHGSIVLGGKINLLFLVGILAAVLCQSEKIAGEARLGRPWPSILMVVLALLSWVCTRRSVREHNQFSFDPICEVAIIFLGIFITMVPALALLSHHRDDLGITEPWQYFWITGSFSAFLDNAPTYMTFATLATGSDELNLLVENRVPGLPDGPAILRAISAGAVFMGAMTYIGNGPNFMVKSIAEAMDYPMPSFFGYMLYSCLILLPVFGLVTWLFFWP